MAGTHPRCSVPNFMESRYGSAQFPVIIQSADGSRTAHVQGDLNIFDCRYLYLIGLDLVPDPPGDVVHFELCDHVLVRDCHLDGGARIAQETLKANQSQYLYIESSDIHGAFDNAIDYVAVQYGHVINNRIHDAQDWCEYAKGGSAYLRDRRQRIFRLRHGRIHGRPGDGLPVHVAAVDSLRGVRHQGDQQRHPRHRGRGPRRERRLRHPVRVQHALPHRQPLAHVRGGVRRAQLRRRAGRCGTRALPAIPRRSADGARPSSTTARTTSTSRTGTCSSSTT